MPVLNAGHRGSVIRQRNPSADQRRTRQFHRMLRRLKEPPRPIDGVTIHRLAWLTQAQTIRVDVRMLK